MPSRRSLLSASTALLASASFAGCSTVLGGATEAHYVDVLNGADERHTFAVTVYDADDAVLFEREYDLDAGEGDENRAVEGSPDRVTVVVDGDETEEVRWAPSSSGAFASNHPDGCPDGTSSSLTLRYGDDYFRATWGCETVRE